MLIEDVTVIVFPDTRCGVYGGDGCGGLVGEIAAVFRGVTFHGGFMVYQFDDLKPNACPHCERLSHHVYLKVDSEANRTAEIDREIEAALSVSHA